MNNDDLDSGATLRGFTSGQMVFNRYKLTRILGQGGMGVVWLAHDETLDQDMALKFLPEEISRDEEAVRDLKRETKKSLRLTHPRIVRIHDFMQDARHAAISMEYVEGRTLTSLKLEQSEGCFDVQKLAPWVEQLCEVLTYAHNEAKIVHRDLKPANLMVTDDGMLKVTDFGISATLTDSTTRASRNANSTSGTPVYMSPQQMLGQHASPTDDVYSIGATIYELLTGKPPFYSGNIPMQVQGVIPPTMTARRMELGVENAAPIPDVWEKTVAACLSKEAEERPQSAAEVWERLNGTETHSTSSLAYEGKSEEGEVTPAKEQRRISIRSIVESPIVICALVALVACGWWFGIHVPEQKKQAELVRQQEAARQDVANKAAATKAAEARKEQEKQEAARVEAAKLAAAEVNAKGSLVIDSTPQGATVIDRYGKNCGATPLRFDEIQPGNYSVTLKNDGYEDVTLSGNVVKNETLRLYTVMKLVHMGATIHKVVCGDTFSSVAKQYGVLWKDLEQANPNIDHSRLKIGQEIVIPDNTLMMPTTTVPEPPPVSVPVTNNQNVPTEGSNFSVKDCAIDMVWISPGLFTMGSPKSEPEHERDETQHLVTLTKGYWIGKYEVTQKQWKTVMGTTLREQVVKALNDNTLYNLGGKKQTLRDFWGLQRDADPTLKMGEEQDNLPMYYISWSEAQEFCKALTEKERAAGQLPSGYEYILPTEAQWEYACRAGTTTATYAGAIKIWGENNAPILDAIAWYGGNSSVDFSGRGWNTSGMKGKQYPGGTAGPRVVGAKQANAWGLYDMCGNVWEWCADWYGSYPSGNVTDPVGAASGSQRVFRGGGWIAGASNCRSATRGSDDQSDRSFTVGFRIALRSVQ